MIWIYIPIMRGRDIKREASPLLNFLYGGVYLIRVGGWE